MNQAGDDVFASSALTVNQHRDVSCSDFCEPIAKGLHGFGIAKNDRLGRNFAEGLYQRTDRICHCAGHIDLRLLRLSQ